MLKVVTDDGVAPTLYPVTVQSLREAADKLESGKIKRVLLMWEDEGELYQFARAGTNTEMVAMAAVQLDNCLAVHR